MDRKINDVNEMIEHNRVYEHAEEEERVKTSSSNRSTPILDDKSKDDESNENENVSEAADDTKDRCGGGNVKNLNSRAMTEELSLKEKEVSVYFKKFTLPIPFAPRRTFL